MISDVLDAAQELEQSLVAVVQFRDEIIPASRKVRDAAYRRCKAARSACRTSSMPSRTSTTWCGSTATRWCGTARAILDLNTAVGERVLP